MTGDGIRQFDAIVTTQTGDVTRLIGDAEWCLCLGLVAGDNARASSWLAVGILIGGAVNLRDRVNAFSGLVPFLGLLTGEVAGLECDELSRPGPSVSELVAAETTRELGREPTRVSEEKPAIIWL